MFEKEYYNINYSQHDCDVCQQSIVDFNLGNVYICYSCGSFCNFNN